MRQTRQSLEAELSFHLPVIKSGGQIFDNSTQGNRKNEVDLRFAGSDEEGFWTLVYKSAYSDIPFAVLIRGGSFIVDCGMQIVHYTAFGRLVFSVQYCHRIFLWTRSRSALLKKISPDK